MSRWERVDAVAHFLYCPAMLGRRSARATPLHRVHLIPARALAFVCYRLDRRLGLTEAEARS